MAVTKQYLAQWFQQKAVPLVHSPVCQFVFFFGLFSVVSHLDSGRVPVLAQFWNSVLAVGALQVG